MDLDKSNNYWQNVDFTVHWVFFSATKMIEEYESNRSPAEADFGKEVSNRGLW